MAFAPDRRAENLVSMENYRIYFQEGEEEDILRILRQSSDILIDNISGNSIGITVEREDADHFYLRLLNQLDREVFDFRPHNGHYQTGGHFYTSNA
jgi:hypothetical protein